MSEKRTRKITIYDIAGEAGVSPASVSRVLNGSGQTTPLMRKKVQDAAEKLGFFLSGTQGAAVGDGPFPEQYHFRTDSVISIRYSDKQSETLHQHGDIELFYVMEGNIHFSSGNGQTVLAPGDFLTVNPQTAHGYSAEDNVLCAHLYIKYHVLCRKLGRSFLSLSCNSAGGQREDYEELRALLNKIFYWDISSENESSLYTESLFYRLLHLLVSKFGTDDSSGSHSRNALRVSEIENYIQNNYQEPVTLNELARDLYISPSGLSKYFKKNFGSNFTSYLSEVRLEHALEDLRQTKKSITRIAMDNGFPNGAAFTQAFRNKYHMTPSSYVETMTRTKEREGTAAEDVADRKISRRVKEYYASPDHLTQIIEADAADSEPCRKYWNRMINIGRAEGIFYAEMREQLVQMRKELGFRYIRFWSIYDLVTFHTNQFQNAEYNFSRLDRLFDFLCENSFTPFIELGFKPTLLVNITEGEHHFFRSEQKENIFETPEDYENFLCAFARHYCARYGKEEFGRWYFEQWLDPRQVDHHDYSGYWRYFSAAFRALKKGSGKIRLGCGGFSVTEDIYKELLRSWGDTFCTPDFLSIYCYPYTDAIAGTIHQSPAEQLKKFKRELGGTPFGQKEILITEWNFTVSDRNALNDRCFKSAYIVHNTLECIGKTDMMGYWYASDLLAEYVDTQLILNGSNGLVSCNGLKKPAYYAFLLLNRLGKSMLYHDSSAAVTTDNHSDYYIICHNYKAPGYQYIIRAEDDLQSPGYYENDLEKQFIFRISNVKNGNYTVKIHSVNDQSGSIHNEWKKMGFPSQVNKMEINYLKSICIPRIQITSGKAEKNFLQFETKLSAQEVQFIELIYQME